MSENNETAAESNNHHTAGSSSILRPSFLRPSVLSSALSFSSATESESSPKSKEVSSTTTNINPFMRDQKDEEDGGGSSSNSIEKSSENEAKASTSSSSDSKSKNDKNDSDDERPDPLNLLRKNGMERANLFAAAKSSIEKSGFVFGQNVHERVVGDNINPDSSSKTENADSTSGELLFSSVIQNAAKSNDLAGSSTASGANAAGSSKDSQGKSLTDVAREYEESRAQKRKLEEVETFTGEENEVNIVDINCKLFAFVNSNWEERGRGSLRLNDSKVEQECSRIVFRTSGNLRLLLNTKVWAGMVVGRPSQKALRLTAMDNTGKIKIFLAQARPLEINQLYKALVERIELRKLSHPEECRAVAGGLAAENQSENNGSSTGSETEKNGTIELEKESDDEIKAQEEENAAAEAALEPQDDTEHEENASPPKKALVAAESTNN